MNASIPRLYTLWQRVGPDQIPGRSCWHGWQDYLEQVSKLGRAAPLLAGGEATEPVKGGFYVQPTIFDGVKNDMTIAREEIFGPVLSVLSFTDAADVVRQANSNIYGLQAAVWTRDINRAQIAAWKKGIKTIYYVRLRQTALEGTEVQGCVSCSL